MHIASADWPFLILGWSAAIAFGLMAGVYFAFSAFVMRALAALEDASGVEAMKSINRVIVRTAFLPLFFFSSLIAVGLIIFAILRADTAGAAWMLAAGSLIFWACSL